MSGRADLSTNWRVKAEAPASSPTATQQEQQTPPPKNVKDDPVAFQAMAEGRRLYVGNLTFTAKREDIAAHFQERDCTLVRVVISVDPFTGRNPSFCFVELATKEQADLALVRLDGTHLLGRPIRVKLAVPRSERSSTEEGHVPYVFQRRERSDGASQQMGPNDQGSRLYVGGIPSLEDQGMIEREIRKLFDGFNIVAFSKLFSPHPSKATMPGNHHYLFVDLLTAKEAQEAMEAMNQAPTPWGSNLRIGRAKTDGTRVGDERTQAEGVRSPSGGFQIRYYEGDHEKGYFASYTRD